MTWRIADSLLQLRDEVNAQWPNRSKASDGFIGDAAHAATASDHNPNAEGVVCAFDITHDPSNGVDIATLFELFRTQPQEDCKYVIANGRIASRLQGWTSRPYSGDPHTNHIHVSVGVGSDGRSAPGTYDSRQPWRVSNSQAPDPQPNLGEEDVTFIAEFLDPSLAGRKYLVTPWASGGPQPGRYGIKVHIDNPEELNNLLAAKIPDRGKIPGGGYYKEVT